MSGRLAYQVQLTYCNLITLCIIAIFCTITLVTALLFILPQHKECICIIIRVYLKAALFDWGQILSTHCRP